MFIGEAVELFDIVLTMHGLGNFADELRNAVDVSLGRHKLKVLRVERILASKRSANRPKDRLVIPVLEDSIAAANIAPKPAKRKAAHKSRR